MLELYRMCIGKMALVAKNILDLRAAPAIDRLIVITHGCNAADFTGEQSQPGILNGIGILKLIHENMLEALLIVI